MPIDPGGPNDSHFDRYGAPQPGLGEPMRQGPGVLVDEPLDKKELRKKAKELSELELSLLAREEAVREKEESLASLAGTK